MRIAVIADVHANLVALRRALDDIERRGVDRIVCLGDVVGYNSSPRETIALLKSLAIESVQGNHDLMAVGRIEPVRCGPNARRAIQWTRQVLGGDDKKYLLSLPDRLIVDGEILLLHSALGDPCVYLQTPGQFREQFAAIRRSQPAARICLTGHTHVRIVVEVNPAGQVRIHHPSHVRLRADCFYFLNPGSVGHPRDDDYRASYAIYDSGSRAVVFRKVSYDSRRVRRENEQHAIYTDLGPSVLRHQWRVASGRLRRLMRRASVAAQ
jgi:predicted phosphodiesterase